MDWDRAALQGLRGLQLGHLCGGDIALDDVIQKHRLELRRVLAELGQGRLRNRSEGRIGAGRIPSTGRTPTARPRGPPA